jgi:hypothetical protein
MLATIWACRHHASTEQANGSPFDEAAVQDCRFLHRWQHTRQPEAGSSYHGTGSLYIAGGVLPAASIVGSSIQIAFV